MKTSDWIMVAAILIGPICATLIALWGGSYFDDRREKQKNKLKLFATLMATRASMISTPAVEAINSITLVFAGKNKADIKVLEAWLIYVKHLNTPSPTPEEWLSKRVELLLDLLFYMGKSLNYNFDRNYIKDTSYFPRRYSQVEEEMDEIRTYWAAISRGDKTLPLEIKSIPR